MENILDCGHVASKHGPNTTGYGVDKEGKKHCYACCAEGDKKDMHETGCAVLYLTLGEYDCNLIARYDGYNNAKVTNWSGTLSLRCSVKIGRHNIAGKRYDVWFQFEGQNWHGVTYGDNTQICHCKKLKK